MRLAAPLRSGLAALLLAVPAGLAHAGEFDAPLQALAAGDIAAIAADPALVAAILAQNARTLPLSEAEIDALDKAWRAEVAEASRPTIEPVLTGPVADMLRARRDASAGLFTEIFAMDARGLNVAASDVTSDYWQGDEDKWQKSFQAGPGALHLSEVELDESTQTYQAQVSVPVIDPATGKPVGALTFGVNVGLLD
jgi:hypothetical protein